MRRRHPLRRTGSCGCCRRRRACCPAVPRSPQPDRHPCRSPWSPGTACSSPRPPTGRRPESSARTGDHYLRRVGDELYVIPVESPPRSPREGRPRAAQRHRADPPGPRRRATDTLPLIVEATSRAPAARQTLQRRAALESVVATPSRRTSRTAATCWPGSPEPTRRAGGIAEVWLDPQGPGIRRRPSAISVPQIGAPQAWARGFDGTGRWPCSTPASTPTHPDLAGRVVERAGLHRPRAIADIVGHGTHVASTIAGTGAADAARTRASRRAPTCSSARCSTTTAAARLVDHRRHGVGGAQGADVVNMSLGGTERHRLHRPDGPGGRRADRADGTLFVIAAGNSGRPRTSARPGLRRRRAHGRRGRPRRDAPASPAAARGSATHALKPEIAAPGVGIVAARGRQPRRRRSHYTRMSARRWRRRTSPAPPRSSSRPPRLDRRAAQGGADRVGQRLARGHRLRPGRRQRGPPTRSPTVTSTCASWAASTGRTAPTSGPARRSPTPTTPDATCA